MLFESHRFPALDDVVWENSGNPHPPSFSKRTKYFSPSIMVKILMVHGFGTNANIFEVQIGKFRV